MKSLGELGRRIADEQDRRSEQLDLDGIRARLGALLVKRAPRRRTALVVSGVTLVAAAAGLALFLGRDARRALEFHVEGRKTEGAESAWISALNDEPLPIAFSDGSRVVLWDRARARVVRLAKTGADVAVEQGRAEIAIVPRDGNHWRVDLGPFVVQVTGTRFDVEWDPDTQHFSLTMHEGKVIVSGCAIGTRTFVAGEMLRVSCQDQQFQITSSGKASGVDRAAETNLLDKGFVAPAADSAMASDSGVSRAGKSEPKASPQGGARWRALAEAGHFREAFALADAAGFAEECRRASAGDLMLLGNAARLAGETSKARQAYTLLRKRFVSDRMAAVAAFNMARVEFELAADYPAAATWFRVYLREEPRGALAREAHGRLLEALQRSGDAAGARRAAEEYLSQYPAGPHAEFAKRLAH